MLQQLLLPYLLDWRNVNDKKKTFFRKHVYAAYLLNLGRLQGIQYQEQMWAWEVMLTFE